MSFFTDVLVCFGTSEWPSNKPHALERPLFQYTYQIADDRVGNGDGRIQRGEQVTMYLTVKNVGKGR